MISKLKVLFQEVKLFVAALLSVYIHRSGFVLNAANTLTNAIPFLYAAMDVVSRERIGFAAAVMRDSNADRVAINQTLNIPVIGAHAAVDITPGATSPDSGATTPGNVAVTISNQKMVPINWNGDEQVVLSQAQLYDNINTQRFAQAFRTISNLVEADLGGLAKQASRAYGTAGTAPFGTANDLSDMAQALKILEDNGAPMGDIRGVLGTAAMANIRGKQSVLFKANEAGTDAMLRRGIVGDILGAGLHTSAGIITPTAGTGASYTTNTAGYAVGATAITLITGTGTILAGDIISITGDSEKYVVASALSGGIVTIAEPGLRKAIAASATNVTVVAAAARNMVFSRSSMLLAARTPYMPNEGDQAKDVMDIQDPVSGITFQVALYAQYRQVHMEIGLAWGVKMIAPRHAVNLLG